MVRDLLAGETRALIAGDWHGNLGWVKQKVPYLCRKFGARLIIQLGDFGFTPGGNDFKRLDALLGKHGLVVVFVDGNHENYPVFNQYPKNDGFQQLGDNIYRILRGTVFTLGELTCMGVGGAGSIDKQFRTPGVDWFPDEYITGADAHTAITNSRNTRVDVMFTHDAPANIRVPMEKIGFTPTPVVESACTMNRVLLQSIVDTVAPRLLFHGHYHTQYATKATIHRPITPTFTVEDDMMVVGVNKDDSHGKLEPGFVPFDTRKYCDNNTIYSTYSNQ